MCMCLAVFLCMPNVMPDSFGSITVEAASKVKLNKKKATLYVGETLKLKVQGTKSKVEWSSNKKSVATVSSKGKVTAKKKGTATITAKVDGKKYNCKITVKNPYLNKKSISLTEEETFNLKLTGSSVKTWSSSNTSVVMVDANGKVTAVGAGTATITAKVGKKKYKCKITVKKNIIPITDVVLDKTELNMEIGDSELLNVDILPKDTTEDTTIEWISSDDNVATVNLGVVTAKAEGTATIFAKIGGKSCSCKVTVKPKVVEITDFNVPESMVVRLGGVKTISISYAPSNATETFSPSFTSENLNIATVTGEGIISPISLGETNIKVKFKTIEKTIKVTVEKSKQTLINEENQRYDAEVNRINMELNDAIAELQWDYENGYRTESQYNIEFQELHLVSNQKLEAALKTHNQNLENINALPD